MGNRRMGAQRLNALLKRGALEEDTSRQAGPSAANMIVSHNMRREGKLIVTEIALDLGGNGNTISCGGSADRPIGTKSSTDPAQLMQWQDATHGQFVFAEVVVLETANGETAMSLLVMQSRLMVKPLTTVLMLLLVLP